MRPIAQLLVLALAAPAALPPARAQDEAAISARRSVIERDQQSESFSLRLRQSESEAKLPAGSPSRRALEALHLEQRQRQEALHDEQLREAGRAGTTADEQVIKENSFERARRAQDLDFATRPAGSGPAPEPLPR